MSRRTPLLLLLPLSLALTSPLFADITSVGTVTGAGGTGTASPGSFSTVADVSLDFTSIAPLSFTVTVDGSGGYVMNSGDSPSTGIVNDTGVAWDGLLFQASGSPAPDVNGVEPFSSNFSTINFLSGEILLNDGTLAPGDTYNVDLGFATSAAETVTVTYTPLTAATPLPNTALCGAALLAGALYVCRRRSASRIAV